MVTMNYGAESNDRTERESCGDENEMAAMERWIEQHPQTSESVNCHDEHRV